jgi:hypothetical protein
MEQFVELALRIPVAFGARCLFPSDPAMLPSCNNLFIEAKQRMRYPF